MVQHLKNYNSVWVESRPTHINLLLDRVAADILPVRSASLTCKVQSNSKIQHRNRLFHNHGNRKRLRKQKGKLKASFLPLKAIHTPKSACKAQTIAEYIKHRVTSTELNLVNVFFETSLHERSPTS